ncbi:trehalose utilization protein ThuA [Alicyclobacillus sp. TC]|nr:ThuA domain-containing protein [Alicyclobacillus sp. TC]QRF24594.1 trehalose utilization protein ThuA [Alicyclobacillus sp. TC]
MVEVFLLSVRITVWNEFRHEQKNPKVSTLYPNGIHEAIASPLREKGYDVKTATLDQPMHGLNDKVLDETDVLIWWGHIAHQEVSDEIVEKVVQRVWKGMGLIVLHSAHFSKVFKRLMGTSCDLKWREANDKERLWVVQPNHPIVQGINEFIELPQEEMYGEYFDIPQPEELIFLSWFSGGEVFRSGCTYHRGLGKIFYFRPGHETFPTYHHPEIQRVLANAVEWAAPHEMKQPICGKVQALETLPSLQS